MMLNLRTMTQQQAFALTERQAEAAVKAIKPGATVRWVQHVTEWKKRGYVVSGAGSRCWTGYCKTEGSAWRSAAWSLWQAVNLYENDPEYAEVKS